MFKALFKSRAATSAMASAVPGTVYAYKASLIGAAHLYELGDDGLSWRTGRRSGVWSYKDIMAIRLSYRPTGMQRRRFRADLTHVDGRRITMFSTSKQTVALMEPQAGYGAFILEMHRRLAAAGSTANLSAGLQRWIYVAIVAALVFVGLVMLALLLRAVLTAELAGMAFIIGFGAFFGWQVRGFLRRNKPRAYRVDDVPSDLLS